MIACGYIAEPRWYAKLLSKNGYGVNRPADSPGGRRITERVSANGLPCEISKERLPIEVRFRFGSLHRGVFATAPIPKGSLCWDFSDSKQNVISEPVARELLLGGKLLQGELMDYLATCYWQGKDMIDLRNDDGRYFNHSGSDANMALGEEAAGQDPRNSYTLRCVLHHPFCGFIRFGSILWLLLLVFFILFWGSVCRDFVHFVC